MEFKLCVRVREIVGVWRLQEAFASSSPGRRADGPDAGTPCTVCRAFGGFSTRSLAKDKVARVLQSGILSQSRGREFCRDCFSVRSEVVLGARVRRFLCCWGQVKTVPMCASHSPSLSSSSASSEVAPWISFFCDRLCWNGIAEVPGTSLPASTVEP